jgi:hypothetical protein
MKALFVGISSLLVLLCATVLSAQHSAPTSANNAVVPPLVKFSGTLSDLNGKPLSGVVGVTLALYKEQRGGAPLWLETQNVQLDQSGHYSIMLGSTSSTGLPAEIFAGGEARWLGVQPQSQEGEQPRVLLLSVPYALKAGDAQTLGGLPASAFVRAAPPISGSPSVGSGTANPTSALTPGSTDVTTSGGRANTLPLFNTATDIENSAVTQIGSGTTAKIGIATTTPVVTLDVNGSTTIRGLLNLPAAAAANASAGSISRPFGLVASTYNSSKTTALNQVFRWQAEPVGNNTVSPSASLNLLFATSPVAPAETGLSIASNGLITFAPGQTFPGAGGGITGLTAGTDLTGGGTTGNVTLNLNTASTDKRYAQLAANNIFTGTQTINNTVTISGKNTSGALQVDNTVATGLGPAIVGTTLSTGANAIKGIILATSGTSAGLYGQTSSTTGYGVYGVSPSVAIYGTGQTAIEGIATSASGYSGRFENAPVSVEGDSNRTLIGDPGCGAGYAGLGMSTGSLSGCTNYALLGGPKGDTYINSSGTATIHFRSNNNELVTINNDGDMKVIGQSGGGNLTVEGNADQARGMGGFAKALAYVNLTTQQTGQIVRCFNSQNNSSTAPCGFTFTYLGLGDYIIDFGFQVSDRFIQVTPVFGGGGFDSEQVGASLCLNTCSSITSHQIEVFTFYTSTKSSLGPQLTNTPFYITVF